VTLTQSVKDDYQSLSVRALKGLREINGASCYICIQLFHYLQQFFIIIFSSFAVNLHN
jgi:hypothetical protein